MSMMIKIRKHDYVVIVVHDDDIFPRVNMFEVPLAASNIESVPLFWDHFSGQFWGPLFSDHFL